MAKTVPQQSLEPASIRPAKRWWKISLLALAVLLALFVVVQIISIFTSPEAVVTNTAGRVSFEKRLAIPQLADSTAEADGTRVFTLTLQTGTTNFFDDKPTRTWGVNQAYLGPTLRAKKGEKVRVDVRNNLPETSSLHWHGMHLPAQMDGGPHQPVKKGGSWAPHWTVNQPAATLWYHPHPHGQTEEHIYRGIAGLFIIDEEDSAVPSLPSTYGTDDLPVIIQDKQFDTNRQFVGGRGGSGGPLGTLGDQVLVNGVRTPHVNVSTELVRLRLLNGSTARIYNFGLSNNQPMQLVASDGGLLEKPVALQRLMLAPGERAEILVAMQPNERVVLRSFPFRNTQARVSDKRIGAQDRLDIMELRAGGGLAASPRLPDQLATIPNLGDQPVAATRRFDLTSSSTINNKRMDMNRIDLAVAKDTNEIWEVTNTTNLPHTFHVHDVQYQVLTLGGAPPPPELAGWKDTVLISPRQTARLIMRFADYGDPNHPYMFHCHLLRHEDSGMMGQFVVVEPGQAAGDPPAHHTH
jgi:blue copper oxidase